MPDSDQQVVPPSGESQRKLRITVLVVAGLETLAWLYTFVYAARYVQATGEYFAWMLPANATLVYLGFVLPALLLGIFAKGGWLELAGLILVIPVVMAVWALAS